LEIVQQFQTPTSSANLREIHERKRFAAVVNQFTQ
jgi:hypothetical protein